MRDYFKMVFGGWGGGVLASQCFFDQSEHLYEKDFLRYTEIIICVFFMFGFSRDELGHVPNHVVTLTTTKC